MPEVFRQNPFVIKDLDDFDIESATDLAELLNKVVSVVELKVQIIGAAPVKQPPKEKPIQAASIKKKTTLLKKRNAVDAFSAFQVN